MKNLFIYIISTVFLLQGCYYTTIKKKPAPAMVNADTTAVKVPVISAAELQKYKAASAEFYANTLERSHFSGEFLVAKKGEIIYEKYAGFEDAGHKSPVSENSPLHLASVSKTFTAMAVLKLWENGKIDLNAPIATYLPGFDYEGVTVKTLLNHRSGLPNYVHVMEQLGWDRKKIVHNDDVLQFLITNKAKLQVARADRSFRYCNTNYALLALIIEKASGLPYPQFIYENFFAPLGMTHSYVFTMSDSARCLPSFNWKNQQEAFTFLDAVYGDKNIYSTVRDLLKWETALSYSDLFKQQTLDSAYTGYSHEKKGIKNYGLGWRMLEYPNNEKIIFHNGWWHGNNTVFARILKDSATVIILGNKYNRNIYQARKLFPAFGDYHTDEDTDE